MVDCKLANIPSFKMAKKEDLGYYRPLGLASVPGKIMEKFFFWEFLKNTCETTQSLVIACMDS